MQDCSAAHEHMALQMCAQGCELCAGLSGACGPNTSEWSCWDAEARLVRETWLLLNLQGMHPFRHMLGSVGCQDVWRLIARNEHPHCTTIVPFTCYVPCAGFSKHQSDPKTGQHWSQSKPKGKFSHAWKQVNRCQPRQLFKWMDQPVDGRHDMSVSKSSSIAATGWRWEKIYVHGSPELIITYSSDSYQHVLALT